MDDSKRSRENCRRCEYFYITWDRSFPYGCRGMGFKSRYLPSRTVYQSTGEVCLMFKPKQQKSGNA